ncbi:MAG: recombinase family protein, partial [Nevskia sp.]|nr:recombinase family protein [Nevskia sp.]
MSPNKRRSPNAQLAKIRAELGPVAEYVRKSTDYQRYSVEYQSEAIRKYAVQHHMTVVRSYVDDGRSGLTLQGRPGLKKLLNDVISGDVDFSAILVYDISRWGRFQDIDESAYYEFMCKRAGVRVIYCAELFDDTPMGVLMKNMKRVMAGEHSR